MNWKAIASVALIGTGALISGVCVAAEEYAEKNSKSTKRLVELLGDDEKAQRLDAHKQIAEYNVLKEVEGKKIKNDLAAWKKTARYDERKKEIYSTLNDEIDAFKQSIDYDAKKNEIVDRAANELTAFKESIEYDEKVGEFKKTIEEAKAEYQKKIKLCEAMGSDISETAGALKLEAEKVKNKAVSDAEGEIKKLKAQVDSEATKINRVKQADIQKIESQLLNEKTRLEKASQKDLDDLEKQLNKAKEDIARDIYSMRTEDDLEAIRNFDENTRIVDELNAKASERSKDILDSTPRYEKLAEYFKAKECPKWCVAVVGVTPLVPVGYLSYKYVELLTRTIKAM